MYKSLMLGSVASVVCALLVTPIFAADPIPTPPDAGIPSQPAAVCLSDLRAFDVEMEKDGYWYTGGGYSMGYPVAGYGYSGVAERGAGEMPFGYEYARPGYEVRNLMASATILARHGNQQPCEDVLATTRVIYQDYLTALRSGKEAQGYGPQWQQVQLKTAIPVTDDHAAFRSDQLVGADVRNVSNVALGTVNDIVISPETGKIAYLVIGRGGFFGIDEKYVPVPWASFKITPAGRTLVLNVEKAALGAAPMVKKNEHASVAESKMVDAYWLAHGPVASAD